MQNPNRSHTAMQTMIPVDASVQAEFLASEVTQTEPETALEISNPPNSVDASVESVDQSGNREQHTDSSEFTVSSVSNASL
uniref:Uncharacterized protein n=1 Tax=Trichobilharzia regenti TaxID=157069 RepID=A0AA85KLM7_TRIRE|nr:unnamed protein product [Trichobilharzia regenti]